MFDGVSFPSRGLPRLDHPFPGLQRSVSAAASQYFRPLAAGSNCLSVAHRKFLPFGQALKARRGETRSTVDGSIALCATP